MIRRSQRQTQTQNWIKDSWKKGNENNMQLHIYFLFRNYITCHTSAFDKVCMPQKVVVPHCKNGGKSIETFFFFAETRYVWSWPGKGKVTVAGWSRKHSGWKYSKGRKFLREILGRQEELKFKKLFFTQKLLLEPVFDGNIAFLWACINKTLFLDLWYIGDRGCGHLRWKRHGTVSKSFLPNRIPYQIYHLIGFDTKLSTACTACRMWTQGGHLESPALRSSSSPHSALWPSASCLSSLGEDLCSHHYTIYKVCIRPVHKNLFLEFPK